jgi:hypothetical protein
MLNLYQWGERLGCHDVHCTRPALVHCNQWLGKGFPLGLRRLAMLRVSALTETSYISTVLLEVHCNL